MEGATGDITDLWREDLVDFALGCSFTFEHALQKAGIPVWHIDNDTTVPMYRSNIDTGPAGPFSGKTVVSMRAIDPDRLDEARAMVDAVRPMVADIYRDRFNSHVLAIAPYPPQVVF